MSPDKKIMFQARLQRRLRELGINSFDMYAEKLLGEHSESPELAILVDYISTNKTDFFREKEHFNFLSTQLVPEFLGRASKLGFQRLNIWSAGCSSGQEPYSIAITLEEFMRLKGISFDYSIVATDISGRMLKALREAIYPMAQIEEVSLDVKHRYFLKSKNVHEPKVRVIKEVRDHVQLAYLNLMDNSYTFNTKFDVVFLRNTLIYFNSETQRRVLVKVLENMNAGAYLIIGHSESLINMELPIKTIAPSVYIKTNTI